MHPGYVVNKQIYSHVLSCKFVEEVVFKTLIVGVKKNISFKNFFSRGRAHGDSKYDNRSYTEKNDEVAPFTAAKVTGVHNSTQYA